MQAVLSYRDSGSPTPEIAVRGHHSGKTCGHLPHSKRSGPVHFGARPSPLTTSLVERHPN